MASIKLYSKEHWATKSPVVYQHTELPQTLRNQIVTIFERILGRTSPIEKTPANKVYEEATRILRHEYGLEQLMTFNGPDVLALMLPGEELRRFFQANNIIYCLDVIQVLLTVMTQHKEELLNHSSEISIDEGTAEINERFREHGVGFQIVDGEILKIESEIVFQNATTPALNLLRQPYLSGANQEFLSAYGHLRHGRYKECLTGCGKAFESTMKAICHKRGWTYDPHRDTASKLIEICEANGLFASYQKSHLTGLRSCLEGVITPRNRLGAHGQGTTPIVVDEHVASYVLNLAASNILFLVNSEKALP
jgi:hypothetical protein